MSFLETERDLLIRISERIEGLVATASKLEKAMTTKAEAEEVVDLKKRVTALEKRSWMFAGAIGAVQLILKYFWIH